MPKEFGEKTIEVASSIKKRQFSSKMPSFAYVPVSIDEVEDEDAIMNVGQQKEYSFLRLFMESNQQSSWTNYPENYKFFSVHFHLNDNIVFTERATYDLLDYISDLGGMYEALATLFGLLTFKMANIRLKALMTNRLFHLKEETAGLMDISHLQHSKHITNNK